MNTNTQEVVTIAWKMVALRMFDSAQLVSCGAIGDMECEYAIGRTTFTKPGTPGLFAYTNEQEAIDSCRIYDNGNNGNVCQLYLVRATGVTKVPIDRMPYAYAFHLKSAQEFWRDPQGWLDAHKDDPSPNNRGYDVPPSTVLCASIELIERVYIL